MNYLEILRLAILAVNDSPYTSYKEIKAFKTGFIIGHTNAIQSIDEKYIPKENKPTPLINESDLKYFNKNK